MPYKTGIILGISLSLSLSLSAMIEWGERRSGGCGPGAIGGAIGMACRAGQRPPGKRSWLGLLVGTPGWDFDWLGERRVCPRAWSLTSFLSFGWTSGFVIVMDLRFRRSLISILGGAAAGAPFGSLGSRRRSIQGTRRRSR